MKSRFVLIEFSIPNGPQRNSYLTFVYNASKSSVVWDLNSSFYKSLFSVVYKFCQAKYLG